ncbi:MAG: hypothetical protein ABJB74_22800 [Gemmatimonas sp.]
MTWEGVSAVLTANGAIILFTQLNVMLMSAGKDVVSATGVTRDHWCGSPHGKRMHTM